jgi:transposase
MLPTPLPAHARAARRARALALIASGKTLSEAAESAAVPPSTLHYWVKNPRLAKPTGDRRYSLDYKELKRLAVTNPDATLHDLAASLRVSHNAVWKALRIMGLSTRHSRQRAR